MSRIVGPLAVLGIATGGPWMVWAGVSCTVYPDEGCFQDFTDGYYRVLRNGPYEIDGGVTIEKCMQLCYGFGFSLSGVEDGAQCFCDNALQEPITPVDDQIECLAEPCAGNEYEYCGGANRLRVFNVSCNGKSAPNWWAGGVFRCSNSKLPLRGEISWKI